MHLRVLIPVINPYSYETGNSRNPVNHKFSDKNSGMKEEGNVEMIEFSSISKLQHLEIQDNY